MEKFKLFVLKFCPYCNSALNDLEKLYQAEPKYREIPLQVIDESKEPELSDSYDYYYVPTFFYEDKKMHEGEMTYDDVKAVMEEAYQRYSQEH